MVGCPRQDVQDILHSTLLGLLGHEGDLLTNLAGGSEVLA